MTKLQPETKKQAFYNLSSIALPNEMIKILKLGSKHIPITKSPHSEVISKSFERFKNSFGWQAHYYKQNYEDEPYDKNLKLNKSTPTYYFSRYRDDRLEQQINLIESIIDPLRTQESPIIKDHTLHYLKKFQNDNSDTLFKMSDKNMGICIVSLQDYNRMIYQHLKQSNYTLISNNISRYQLLPEIQTTINKYKRLLKPYSISDPNQQVRRFAKYYLDYNDFKLPVFHILPKVHKPKEDNQLTKSRPIIAALNSFTTVISKLLDYKMKNLNLLSTNTLLKTSELPELLRSIELDDNTEYYLVTLDISSLYTNIDTVKLNEILETINPEFAKLSNFITTNNYFQYDYRLFKQTSGIAMGTNAAPTLANLYLSRLLDPFVNNNPCSKMYTRYLDDLLLIWQGDLPSIQTFRSDLNRLIPNIEFDLKFSKSNIAFLDLEVHLQKQYTNSKIWTNKISFGTYHKEIHTFNYLSPKSMHPLHTIKGFIKGELIRFQRNSSNIFFFQKTADQFYSNLRLRGHSRTFLDPIFEANTYLSVPKQPSNSKILPIIVPYTLHSAISTIQKTFYELNQRPQTTRRYIPNSKLLLAFSKKPNISQILTKSNLTTDQSKSLDSINTHLYSDDQCSSKNAWTRRKANS